MTTRCLGLLLFLVATLAGCASNPPQDEAPADAGDCGQMLLGGFRPIAAERDQRFLGKVQPATAGCRGGPRAKAYMGLPYVDWAHYWATADTGSLTPGSDGVGGHLGANGRGIDGALLDLEYQRMELIKFNLFDNSGTFRDYLLGREGVAGPAIKTWPEMRLASGHPFYAAVGGAGPQLCQGELIRFRNLDGSCNDLRNPAMGASHQLFARNVEFETTFPDLSDNLLARNRHGDRLALLRPDPQVISRKLLTRQQSQPDKCQHGYGLPGDSPAASCDYQKAPFFNVLAAFWIQFMTHDWFSHLEDGHNDTATMPLGCSSQRVGNVEQPLSPADVARLGCRPADVIDRGYVADSGAPAVITVDGKPHLTRAYKTMRNNVTAWWDASQIYGYDDTSRRRVKRSPADPARLLLVHVGKRPGEGEAKGYLPVFEAGDPIAPQWSGQEATAFPDNWSIGTSFYTNLFAREHNAFVDAFRQLAAAKPDEDSGLRRPSEPDRVITNRDVSAGELFEAARLVVSAEIAKIHTTEWTPQLLYDEPLYLGMNSNWKGLFDGKELVERALAKIVTDNFGKSKEAKEATQWYSAFASGPGIFGLGSHVYADDRVFAAYDPAKDDLWRISNPDHVNGGINHFGSPFNFPEEFVSVYRLHALVPDLIEYREWNQDPNQIRNKVAVVQTFRGRATAAMRDHGLASWALSMGRQRLGLLTLQNTPQFLQNLDITRQPAPIRQADIAALDILRDRERGVPRFNEFRRQYGLKTLTGFDDFVDHTLPADSPQRHEQERIIGVMREVYGQHRCDATKVITSSQRNDDGSPINDCLGHPDGSLVDNIEDVDTVVGWLAEFTRPHGFAISETQFQVFILNASRRLFSDRFFTSSFRPEFYTRLGVDWVNNNGPDGRKMEPEADNGHAVEVSPLKRVLLRAMPELAPELQSVRNVFDPWARARGHYYSIAWKPRPGAESDPAFAAP
ncbi:peroxidase family protein [Chitinivorax sp. PXF-14]|uniref:peroxidase family protein n=1 Tax=Chitinivorax sp. PXF-14 TaxID=3230488 RepID=UPI0034657537